MGFFSNLVGFENLFSKNITEDVLHNPTRLLTGIDPASTKVWNTVLGRDDQPLVNVYGSPGQQYYDQAQAEGIDTGPAQQFHGLADKVASYYGMQGISGIGGGAAGAGTESGGSGMGLMDMFSSGSGGGSGWGSLLGGVLGAYSANKDSKSAAAAAASQGQLDPRLQRLLFGSSDPNGPLAGLLGANANLLNAPEFGAARDYASDNADYLKKYGSGDLSGIRDAANTLMARGISAPVYGAAQSDVATASVPSYAVGNKVQAPAQNNMDLTGTFSSLLNGGDTSALVKSLQAGNNLTSAQFNKNQTDLTNNFLRNVMPALQSGGVAAGQYGGSRQGIAEGLATSDLTRQLNDSNTQLGLANSANTAGQLAGAYESGQNRALSAAQGLSQQQYAKAMQDANTANQAEFMNVGNQLDVSKTNAAFAQQASQANAASRNNMNQANQSAILQTNSLNNGGLTAGAGLLGGLLEQANSGLSAGVNYAQGVNSTIQPYVGANQNPTQQTYQNTGGNILGGALMGSQLAGMFTGAGSAPASLRNMQGSTSSSLGSFMPSSTTFNWSQFGG